MSGPVFGILIGLIALVGVIAALAVLPSVYREAPCALRAVVIGISIGLVWKAGVAFTTPSKIDGADALLVIGVTTVYWWRLWRDSRKTDMFFDTFGR